MKPDAIERTARLSGELIVDGWVFERGQEDHIASDLCGPTYERRRVRDEKDVTIGPRAVTGHYRDEAADMAASRILDLPANDDERTETEGPLISELGEDGQVS